MLRNIVTPRRILKSQLSYPPILEGDKSGGDKSGIAVCANLERQKLVITAPDSCHDSGRSPGNSVLSLPPRAARPARPKRKQHERAPKRRAKEDQRRLKIAKLKKNGNGLIEIEVTYEHCSKMAYGSGFKTSQVLRALQDDNTERAKKGAVAQILTEANSDSELNRSVSLIE